MLSDGELRKKAEKRAEEKVSFFTHLSIYIAVNALLIAIWWVNGGSEGLFPWFIFPLFGWGIGIVAHFIGAFVETGFADKLAEKEYQRLKNKENKMR